MISGLSGITQPGWGKPGFPDPGAHPLNTDVEDIATNITMCLQSLIYNSEIQKVLKGDQKHFLNSFGGEI